jgi:hypothetical protein
MNNPIDANEFRHYLRFNSLGRTDLYEIPEPIGFDGAQFIKEQEANRYARSIEYGAIDTIEFPDAVDKKLDTPRVYNILGDTSDYMDWGFEFLQHIYDTYGFESDVDYIVTLQGFDFCVGQLDFGADGITDGYSSFRFKLIQDNNVMDFQRQEDTKFNAFATEDVDGNTITPIPTFNYLRRNTPVIRNSMFKLPQSTVLIAGGNSNVNFAQVVEKFGIDNTLSWFGTGYTNEDPAVNNIRLIKAKNDLVNVTVNVDLDVAIDYRVTNPTGNSRMWIGLYYAVYSGTFSGGFIGNDGTSGGGIQRAYFKDASGSVNQIVPLDSNISFTIPSIPRGHYLSVFWSVFWDITNLQNPNRGRFNFTKTDFDITATQVGIDTVIKASRYIDLIKQSVKSIKDVPVTAPDYDVNGKYYNQAVFNRRMISQNTDSFFSTFKDVMESVFELNQDYEISKDGIKILPFDRYYENAEIGSFPILPDRESIQRYNPRFMVNNFKFGYNKFANERDIKGTEEGIHTDSEWLVPNKKVENKKEVKCKFVRDGFMIQDIVNQEIKDPITSTQNDDDVMVEDIIELAPNSVGTFGAFLLMRLEGSNMQILNRDSEGEANDAVFTWTTLGLAVGQSMQITSGVNVGSYNVVTITPNLITLAPVGFTPTFVGDAFIQVRYTYSNVAFQTRTNQGFVSTDNRFLPNVRYSIKRNVLNTWGSYLKSMMLYAKSTFKNVYFKNNGAFTSQENGLLELTENTNIEYSDLPDPILSAKVIDLTVVAEFDEVLDMLETYGTVKGFIRAYDNNGRVFLGYAKKLDYIFSSKELTMTLEQKYEPETLVLMYSDGVLTVNGVAYTVNPETWWLFKNDFVQFYDHKNTPISKYYKFNFISLNGVLYGSATDLQNALLML